MVVAREAKPGRPLTKGVENPSDCKGFSGISWDFMGFHGDIIVIQYDNI
jgi:hypothetical protein